MVCCYGGQFSTWVFGSVHCSRIIIKEMKQMNKQLTFLLSLTFLFFFDGTSFCNNSKSTHLENNNYFSSFGVEGLSRNDSRHFIVYERSFCGQYSMKVIVADSNKFMDVTLNNIPNLSGIPIYGSVEQYHPDGYAFILSKKNSPLLVFKGVYINLKCEDITSDGNPELFVDITYARNNFSRTQYLFSMNDFHQLLSTEESGVTWHDGGLDKKMEDLDGDGIKEYNGWRYYWALINVCSSCRRPPRKIMCFDGQTYVDCTKRFPKLLKEDLAQSREKLVTETEHFKEYIDLFHTELIFMIATSINLNQEQETLDYIKTNFSKNIYDWAIEKIDVILKELGLQKV
jgi:hypothetical protein